MTQQVLATGQVSLVDLNDAKTLSAYVQIVSAAPSSIKQQSYDPNTATYTPSWATNNMIIAPQLYLSGGGTTNLVGGVTSLKWFEVTASGATQITSGSSNYTIAASNATNPYALTIAANKMTSIDNITYRCDMVWPDPDLPSGSNGIAVSADIQFVKVTLGANSALMMLTNENQTVPADQSGNVTSYGGAVSTATVYAGSTDKSTDYTWATPTFNPTAYYTSTAATISADKRTVTFTDIKPTVDSVAVTFQATHNVTSAILQRTFTLSKSKQGIASTAYWIGAPPIVGKKGDGTFNPVYIGSNITATSQSGTAAPGLYAGWFKIDQEIASAPGVWQSTDAYQSSSAENTVARYPISTANGNTGTFLSNCTRVRVRLYTDSGFTNLADTEYIAVVNDGANLIRANISPLAGNIINATNASLQMKCYVFDGSTTATATSYQWYKLDPTATIPSFAGITQTGGGADADGGASWRPLNNVATPAATAAGFGITQTATGGTVAAATYYANFSYVTANGETLQATGTAPSVTTTGTTSKLTITGPTTWPQGVVAVKVYVNTTAATVKLQGFITTPGGSLALTTTPSTTNAAPLATATANWNGASNSAKTGADITTVLTDTLTIYPDGVDSASTFKCVAKYKSSNYADVVSVVDMSDPISVTLERPQGDIFRNGQGTKTIIAHLYQSGTEIDVLTGGGTTAEQAYEYRWYLLDSTGTRVTSKTVNSTTYTWVDSGKQYKTGKSVQVDPNLVDGTATLALEVWSKS